MIKKIKTFGIHIIIIIKNNIYLSSDSSNNNSRSIILLGIKIDSMKNNQKKIFISTQIKKIVLGLINVFIKLII